MLTLLLALAFKYGRSSEDMGIKLINTVKPYVPLERYQISDKLHNEYGEAITELSASFHGTTLDKVNALIKQAKTEEWHKEELASRLREVMTTQRWRVERLARTETHRARGLGQVDAMVSLQNKAQVRITKTWQTVSDKPCEFCLEMAGRTVNVADSYLKTGETVSGGGSDLFINDYRNIDTALLHPNCTCIERFKVSEVKQEIQELKKEDYKKYFKNYTDSWQLEKIDSRNDREKEITKILKDSGFFKEIKIVKRVEKPDGVKTPDLIIDGVKVEIKNPKNVRRIEESIKRSIKQISDNGWIIFDADNSKISIKEYINNIKYRTYKNKIKKIIIIKGKDIIYKKNI